MMKPFHAPGKPYMTNYERAGQFMPFMSLKGFDDMIGDSTDEIVNKEWVHIDFNDDALYDLDHSQDDGDDGERFLER